jgi:formylmethanofuran dehydrogenase subunit D
MKTALENQLKNMEDQRDREQAGVDSLNEQVRDAQDLLDTERTRHGELTKQAQDMNMSLSLFGALIDEYSSADDKFEYLQSSTSYAYDYVANIAKALGKAKEGDVVMVESEYGCHIIMKCEPEDNAYEKDEYKGVFSEFSSYIMKQLLEERCKPHYDKIKIDDKVMALVPSFKEVNTNYYY